MVNSLWRSGHETLSPVFQARGGQAERRAETCATRAGGSETGAHLSCRDEQRSQQSGTYWCPVAGFLPMIVDPLRFESSRIQNFLARWILLFSSMTFKTPRNFLLLFIYITYYWYILKVQLHYSSQIKGHKKVTKQ